MPTVKRPDERKPAVLRTRRLAGRALTFLLGAEDENLREFATTAPAGRAGKTLVKQGPLRITLVALKKGAALAAHQVAGPVSIQVMRGCLSLKIDSGDLDVPAGGLVTLGPGVRHTARAHDDCSILITFAMK